jgi:hypothetical protein
MTHQEATIATSHALLPPSLALLLATFGAAGQALGQADEAPERWRISAEFSLTDQSGNRVLRLLTGGLNVTHLQRDDYRLDAAVQSRYGRSEGELVALSHLGSVAFDLRPNAGLTPFLLLDAERDEFKRLELRLSSGAGAKRTLRRSADGRQESSLSLALLHSLERIGPGTTGGDPAGSTAPYSSQLARWSLRARTSHTLRDGITLRHTTFYQPVWDRMADYLLRSDTGAKILLTERLALSVEYQWKRDARPPSGVEPDDRLLRTGLIIDF